jgi:hypothetical protein
MEAWVSLGGSFVTGSAAINIVHHRLAVFAVGADRQMHVRWRDAGEWHPWQALGGAFLLRPVLVTRDTRSIDLFCVSHDQSVCYRSWHGDWGTWRPLYGHVGGGEALALPSVVTRPPEQLDVFRVGVDFKLYQKGYRDQQWNEWTELDKAEAVGVCAVASDPGLHLFSIGCDRRLRHALQKNAASESWTMLGDGTVVSCTTVVAHGATGVEVYYLLPDRSLRYQTWYDSWDSPHSLEGTIVEPPTVVVSSPKRTDLFVVGEDRAVWQRCRIGDSWTGWRSLGGQAFAPISAVRQGDSRIELFTLGRDSAVWHRTFIAA